MEVAVQLQMAMRSQSIPVPSLSWLRELVQSRRPQPLAPLMATARTRLLASDLTTEGLLDDEYVAAHTLATATAGGGRNNNFTVEVKEMKLRQDVVVQVLDVENVTRSRWEQVEELEAIKRGEQTKGREMIRLPVGDGDDELGDDAATQRLSTQGDAAAAVAATATPKNATHKLVLQDSEGRKVYALELQRIERIAVGKLNIGEKILLKTGTTVARGVILLEPAHCLMLGGKVEAWHRTWLDGRLAGLREGVGADRQQ
ncbi:hypothetical protein B0T24DRAFT_226327 [Lasiosphaeria ovina]|uniref:RecQ-mediated genome instability protein 1 n=1 Tax=Lasiosphaeria ovina TaxID=92902 RepID=A0AAE0NB18_9PEZI|nr:hypothetical protein B0T24DRAFT_226327 [Lasiosphaeria ovina]